MKKLKTITRQGLLAFAGMTWLLTCSSSKDNSNSAALLLGLLAPQSSGATLGNMPGQNPGPLLNDLVVITSDETPPTGTQKRASFRIQGATFSGAISAQTTVTYYRGKRNMAMQPDGTVTHALDQFTENAATAVGTTFEAPADQRFKFIVVARNESGFFAKEITLGQPHTCATAVATPAVFGDCNDYCTTASIVDGKMTVGASYVVKTPSNPDTLLLETFAARVNFPTQFLGDDAQIDLQPVPPAPPIAYMTYTVSTNFGISDSEDMCVEIVSVGGRGNYVRDFGGYVAIP